MLLLSGLKVGRMTRTIDYRGGSAPGLQTPIVYVERCGPRHDEIIIVPVTRKRLNTFVLTSHVELSL